MKKLLLLVAAMLLAVSLSACSGASTFEIAMITDSGGIDDESFNQGTWEGIVEFCDENDLTYKYYKPLEISDAAYLDTIQLAVEGGAKVVVTPGFLFSAAVYDAQTEYPDVKFVILDAEPHTADWSTFNTTSNTLPILFNEHESGFLAGYAAVKEGFTNLGFTGGMAVPAVVKFGVGYIAGAYYAAEEDGVTILGDAKDYNQIRTAFTDENPELEFITDEIMWLPIMETDLPSEDDKSTFQKLLDMLNELDDVQDVYHNVKQD